MPACDGPPRTPACEPHQPPDPVLVVDRAEPSDVPGLCASLRSLVEASGARRVVCDVGAIADADADADTVDALARLALTARRFGAEVRLRGAARTLRALLELAGLEAVVPPERRLGVEALGQPEQGEQATDVEEGVHGDDAAG